MSDTFDPDVPLIVAFDLENAMYMISQEYECTEPGSQCWIENLTVPDILAGEDPEC